MPQIFVFTAGNAEARNHLDASIKSAVDPEKVYTNADAAEHPALDEVRSKVGAFYAWGAEPGPRNVPTWESMQPGDVVLCVYDNRYRHVARVATKLHNAPLAEAIWGRRTDNGNTWEYLYFLTKPTATDVAVESLAPFLNARYQGFTRISSSKVADVEKAFSSVDRFIDEKLLSNVDDFLPNLRRYQAEGTVFQSAPQARRYFVSSVDARSAEIARVDATEPARCTLELYHARLRTIQDAGGRIPLTDLSGTTAVRTALCQGGSLALSADQESVLDVSDPAAALESFLEVIRNLHVDRSTGTEKLYKPIMIACVADGIADGELEENRITFDWIVPRFLAGCRAIGETSASERTAAYPFFYLTSELFWLLSYHDPTRPLEGTPTLRGIQERVRHATLKEPYWTLMQDPHARERIVKELKERWLSGKEVDNVVAPERSPAEGSSLRASIQAILDGYGHAVQSGPFSNASPIWAVFERFVQALKETPQIAATPELHVEASAGKGNWASVPWVAILDSRETTTVRRGIYVVYLFCEDMSGVYLTLNQGVTETTRELGRAKGRQALAERANELRQSIADRTPEGFLTAPDIDLRTRSNLGGDYEASTILAKLYASGNLPDDASLVEDAGIIVKLYEDLLGAASVVDADAWIFQANPKVFDLRGACKALPELRFDVRQSAKQISTGDRVYFWESGPKGGIVATGEILTDPGQLPFSPREDAFIREVVSRSWWKKKKASSSGELIHSSCPLPGGCRRMTPWIGIAASI